MRQEKRLNRRYPVIWELKGKVLRTFEPTGDVPFQVSRDLLGAVSNISAGGLCLLTDDEPEVSSAVRCEIFVPQVPTGIPTLLQVRWVHKSDDGRTYRLGLQFLV